MKAVLTKLSKSTCRWSDTSADISENTPFREFKHTQTYWPLLNIFDIPEYSSYFDCELPSRYSVKTWLKEHEKRVWTAELHDHETDQNLIGNIFVKNCHLLDPVSILKGEYCIPKCAVLPNYNKCWIKSYEKIQSRENQAYIDCLANFLLSRLREVDLTPHCVLFYGARVGMADNYEYKITDQFESLRNESWFWSSLDKIKGRLELSKNDMTKYGFLILNPFNKHNKTEFDAIEDLENSTNVSDQSESVENNCIDDKLSDVNFDDINEIDGLNKPITINKRINSEQSSCVDDDETNTNSDEGSQKNDRDDNADDENDGDEDEDEEDDDDDEDEDEIDITLVANDLPVISILQEQNEGVMDNFLDLDEIDGIVIDTPEWDILWLAWIFQVVACLSVLQKAFLFTHNDLHTNNLVWRKTNLKYLYYQAKDGRVWKVPTFGRIFSIIDFGRAIFNFSGETYISDDHWPGNYAGDQYNFGPFFNPEKPEICPNPSFDLSRLAISLLDGLFDEIPPPKTVSKSKAKRLKKQHIPIKPSKILSSEPDWTVAETESDLFNVLWSWTVDDSGKTIYVNKDYTERFPGFDLYKTIASSVHGAIPRDQFNRDEFNQFCLKTNEKIPDNVKIYSIDVGEGNT